MQHHYPHTRRLTHIRSLTAGAAAWAALFAGCSADVQNMGENLDDTPPPPYSRCQQSTVVSGDVLVENQDQLNELDGCEVIEGNLNVLPFGGADLRPLHTLTRVTGEVAFSEARPPSGWLILPMDSCYSRCPEGVFPLGQSPYQAQYDAGWLGSLDGLESLESVGGLKITGLGAASLAPLANLRTLTDTGLLHLSQCPNLVDLSGLENLSGVSELYVSCDNLENLAPLSLAQQMNIVRISGPQLTDLGALGVRRISGFMELSNTGLANLDGLSELISVGGWLYIMANPNLEDMSGLDALVSAGGLNINDNERLERFPAFAALTQLNALAILGNNVLKDLSLFENAHAHRPSGTNLSQEPWYAHRANTIEVGGNPELESLVIPFPWEDSRMVLIGGNAKLRNLDLNNLRTVDLLVIGHNDQLASVNVAGMAHADALEVVWNPLLATTELEALQTFSSEIVGNASP